VVRGVVDLRDEDAVGRRRPLQGTREQVLDESSAPQLPRSPIGKVLQSRRAGAVVARAISRRR